MPRILVVDDSGYTRSMLRAALEVEGFTDILEVSTGKEAIQKYSINKPDLVLLDIVLVEMDGIEVLRAIKKMDANAKVIIISAVGQEKYINEARALGVLGYIAKPFSPKELITKIREII
ncbi:MAG TPA: response regulator [Candidatus Diapherotrites archaeon]|uniref:Response regulator n=1 Tax=Candidatus Iainarchaeum sp. TaxID=3101447 RepID=A0A7J4JEQ0_9ARCH|nr:response regulator [Candidatus Diapherotrites archaeon]